MCVLFESCRAWHWSSRCDEACGWEIGFDKDDSWETPPARAPAITQIIVLRSRFLLPYLTGGRPNLWVPHCHRYTNPPPTCQQPRATLIIWLPSIKTQMDELFTHLTDDIWLTHLIQNISSATTALGWNTINIPHGRRYSEKHIQAFFWLFNSHSPPYKRSSCSHIFSVYDYLS